MEQEKAANLLRFWIAVDNFQTHLSSLEGNYDGNQTQSDAMILYDKYVIKIKIEILCLRAVVRFSNAV